MDYPEVSADKTHHVFEGSPIYESRFDEVCEFRFPGLAAVRDCHGAYHIDFFGKPLYEARYAEVGSFSDGIAWVKDESGYFYIDETGNRINAETYTHVSDFSYRVATVYHAFCGATHITTAGEMLYNDWYLDALPFEGDTALVRDEEGWLLINRGGEVIARTEQPAGITARGSVRIAPRKNRIAELLAGQEYDAAVILIRHAEREPFYRGEPGNNKLVTVRGEKTAAGLGASLPKISAAYASPMPRCRKTAEAVSGLSPIPDTMLGDPSAFIYDNPASHEFYQNASTASAIRAYIKGAKLPGHYPIREGALRLLTRLKELAADGGVVLCVTHDAFAASFIAEMTGYDFAEDWIDFLDGCILLRRGDIWTLIWREGETVLA